MNQTQQNLLKAITGESVARNRYTFYAKLARKEGYEWIARVFEETADNERAHAEEEMEKLTGKTMTNLDMEVLPLSSTLNNLKASAQGELFETNTMYPDFEKQARKDGEKVIADMFREIGEVEEKHAERYLILANRLAKKVLYKQSKKVEWKCLNCGYIHTGKEAPKVCPVCKKPQPWYMQIGLLR